MSSNQPPRDNRRSEHLSSSRPPLPSHGTSSRPIRRITPESAAAARMHARKRARQLRRRAILTLSLALILLFSIISIIAVIAHRASQLTPPIETGDPFSSESPTDSESEPTGSETSDPAVTPPDSAKPIDPNAPVICIDPGHGFKDGGTAPDFLAPYAEKDVNLAIALKLRDMLESEGYRVIMTRDSDTLAEDSWFGVLLEVNERVEFLRKQERVDYFISIHCNAYSGTGRAWGPRIYYYTKNTNQTESLAESIKAGIFDRLPVKEPGIIDMTNNAYYVLKHQICPAVLIEVGFLTDEQEALNLIDDTWQSTMARGICNGITAHIRSSSNET